MITLPPKIQKFLPALGIGLVVLLLVVFNVWFFRYAGVLRIGLPASLREALRAGRIGNIGSIGSIKVFPTPLPTPTPTPKPIPTGKQSFTVSSGKKTGPQFLKGEITPYDPPRGTAQLWTVKVTSAKPVTKASLTLTTDTMAKTLPLELKEGSPTDGIWTTTWVANDSFLYTYLARFTATDGTEENTVELTLR